MSLIEFGSTKLEDYQIIAPLGKGTYGEVNKCVHLPTESIIALKTFLFEVSFLFLFLISLFLQNVSNGINYSAMREISLLSQLREYPNFVKLLDVIEERDNEKNQIHCVFEYCETTLFASL